jgi:hypothetical protein
MSLLVRFLAPLAAMALVAGCGSSGGGSQAPSTAASPTASGNSADVAAVTQAWTAFFSKDTPLSEKENLLQNGTTTMKPALQALSAVPGIAQLTATVQKVDFPAPDQANVTYQLAVGGTVIKSGLQGKAVKENGHWVVADSTLCGLVQLAAAQGGVTASAIPGCS